MVSGVVAPEPGGQRALADQLPLPLGRHEYKYVVDGQWIHDPQCRDSVNNDCGTLSSIVEVR